MPTCAASSRPAGASAASAATAVSNHAIVTQPEDGVHALTREPCTLIETVPWAPWPLERAARDQRATPLWPLPFRDAQKHGPSVRAEHTSERDSPESAAVPRLGDHHPGIDEGMPNVPRQGIRIKRAQSNLANDPSHQHRTDSERHQPPAAGRTRQPAPAPGER